MLLYNVYPGYSVPSNIINYPTGLFTIYPAERGSDFSNDAIITQYTGNVLDRIVADKNIA